MLTVENLNQSALYRDAAADARAASPEADARVMRYQTVIRMIDAMVTDLVTNLDAEIARARIASVDGRAPRGPGAGRVPPAMGAAGR